MQNNYKGFSLFNEVEDSVLQTYNRARVLVNMAEDHTNKATKRINHIGASLILGYFAQLPMEERANVKNEFSKQMGGAGFQLVH